jgi:hypothetical protein
MEHIKKAIIIMIRRRRTIILITTAVAHICKCASFRHSSSVVVKKVSVLCTTYTPRELIENETHQLHWYVINDQPGNTGQ